MTAPPREEVRHRFSRRTRLTVLALLAPVMLALCVTLVILGGLRELPFALIACWLVVEIALRQFPRTQPVMSGLANNAVPRLMVSALILLLVLGFTRDTPSIVGTTVALLFANGVWIAWSRRYRF